jgi:outer membrane lipopolysaccharide assembly protein LptE/RlpB
VACTENSFHLRGKASLPDMFQTMLLQGISIDSDFALALRKAFEDAGHELQIISSNKQDTQLLITDYEEGKRVVGYGKNREVREFLIFIAFDYEVRATNGEILLPKKRLQVDKTQIYDSEFVLGKTEEERLIRKDLRGDLARKVLIRLRYGYPETENTR